MQFIWSHCYNNELYILYSKAQDMYVSWKLSDLAGTRLNYVVHLDLGLCVFLGLAKIRTNQIRTT